MCLEAGDAANAAREAGRLISDHQRKFRGLCRPLNGECRAPFFLDTGCAGKELLEDGANSLQAL